ncbi:metallophosphoesterase [Halobacillus sp. KGW1]|uniref:metallophosphoesterase family protein n=1 Tax=Halobacillus sp. KGW1 TaxID=1793726 RepID=UPI0007849D29|nr:metallophosphoesterase family protein [Halobacillus sp. KGW1]
MPIIALLADVHGNGTALEAVLQDAKRQGVTDYWFLGDLIMPGPGADDLFEQLDQVRTSAYVRGNWEDGFLDVLKKDIDIGNATDLYVTRLTKYLCERLNPSYIDRIKTLPLVQTKQVNKLHIRLSHHLPDKNYGGDLWPSHPQEGFDRLFDDGHDVAIYAHTHHPLLRYSTNGQLIINPGTVGQPFFKWGKLNGDLRAQYALLEIDEDGISDVRFRKVAYDVERELAIAREKKLPFFSLYEEVRETGVTHTHNHDLLHKLHAENGGKAELIAYFEKHYWT